MQRFLAGFALLSFAMLSTGCHDSCRVLSEQLCNCAENQASKSVCLTRAGNEDGRINPSPDAQRVCQSLLDAKKCDCANLVTLEQKQACGLAR